MSQWMNWNGRRFLLHVLPSGFMRIRHFGLLAVVSFGADSLARGPETTTDTNGRYSLPQPPHPGMFYYFAINRSFAGGGYPAGSNYRGDFLLDTGTCVSRYGVVIDAKTLRPIGGPRLARAPRPRHQLTVGTGSTGAVLRRALLDSTRRFVREPSEVHVA